jgi:hypothetical protein
VVFYGCCINRSLPTGLPLLGIALKCLQENYQKIPLETPAIFVGPKTYRCIYRSYIYIFFPSKRCFKNVKNPSNQRMTSDPSQVAILLETGTALVAQKKPWWRVNPPEKC